VNKKEFIDQSKAGLLSIILWSVISAAYFGTGSITVAGKAGADYQLTLLWSITYSTLACLLLQEAAARLSIVSGHSLGEALVVEFQDSATKSLIYFLIFSAIVAGCAAYQTGNVLGTVSGVKLIASTFNNTIATSFTEPTAFYLSPLQWSVFICGCVAFVFLNIPSLKKIANILGVAVLLMTLSFIPIAWVIKPSFTDLLINSIVPTMPRNFDAGVMVLAMIGTTIVPYDLFLGSAVMGKQGQTLHQMRFGLGTAVIIGGIITAAILIIGTKLAVGEFTFDKMAIKIEEIMGTWARYLFGFGMFIAGFCTMITAPIAAALTAQSLFITNDPERWKTQGLYFKATWMSVLFTGIGFGFMNFKPEAAIILAQALNGLILPFIAIFLLSVVNNRKIMGDKINSWFSNILMAVAVCVCLIVGMETIMENFNKLWENAKDKGVTLFSVISTFSVIITLIIVYKIHLKRKENFD